MCLAAPGSEREGNMLMTARTKTEQKCLTTSAYADASH